jgi:hypothetical protein
VFLLPINRAWEKQIEVQLIVGRKTLSATTPSVQSRGKLPRKPFTKLLLEFDETLFCARRRHFDEQENVVGRHLCKGPLTHISGQKLVLLVGNAIFACGIPSIACWFHGIICIAWRQR